MARGSWPGRRIALVLVVLLAAVALHPAAPGQTAGNEWTRDLGEFEPPYNAAASVTAFVLSKGGHTLVLGTDNGGVIFLNATTGRVIDSAETSTHGSVIDIRLDASGRVAALLYKDGYIAVIGIDHEAPLFVQEANTATTEDAPRRAAALSADGRYLVTLGNAVRLFHRPGPQDTFVAVDSDEGAEGPFIWFHPDLLFFGVLAPDGEVVLYSYSSRSLRALGSRDITTVAGEIAHMTVAGDGNRFAIGLDTGTVLRYTPSLHPENPQLIPDYEGTVGGPPLGLALDQDGERLAAWSPQQFRWIDGCNRNIELCGGKDAEKNTIRLPLPFATRILDAATTPDLARAVVQIDGETRERRLYNLPTLDHFTMAGTAETSGRSLLDATGRTIFLADDNMIEARYVSPAELPPVSGTGEDGGDGTPDPGGFELAGLGTETLLFAGIGLLALLLLVVLVSVFVALRRSSKQPAPPLPTLAPAPDEAFSTLPHVTTGGGGGIPGRIRPVAPSAPVLAPPPEGLLVLQGVHVPTAPMPLAGLDVSLKRAQVVRVTGAAPALATFAALLGGHLPFQGILSVGGASARETPVLFRRRVRVGIEALPDLREDAATAFQRLASAHGLPGGLVARRLEKDLGWMGERLHRPLNTLRPLDQWKVRLALALVDRPHLLTLHVNELPWGTEKGSERTETLRRILSGVARQYDTLVLVLDDRSVDPYAVRSLADEELVLDVDGFRERHLLKDGRPVKGATPGTTPAKPRRRGTR